MGRSLLKTPVKSGLPGVYPVFRSRSSHLPQPGYDIMPTVSPFRLGHKAFDLGRMPDGIISPQHLLTNWQAKSRDFSSKALQNPGSGVILGSRCGSCGAFRFHEDARTGVAGGSPRCSNAVARCRTELNGCLFAGKPADHKDTSPPLREFNVRFDASRAFFRFWGARASARRGPPEDDGSMRLPRRRRLPDAKNPATTHRKIDLAVGVVAG